MYVNCECILYSICVCILCNFLYECDDMLNQIKSNHLNKPSRSCRTHLSSYRHWNFELLSFFILIVEGNRDITIRCENVGSVMDNLDRIFTKNYDLNVFFVLISFAPHQMLQLSLYLLYELWNAQNVCCNKGISCTW